MTEIERKAVIYAAQKTLNMFRGRKGHRGGACTYRQLRPAELRAIIADAFLDGANSWHEERSRWRSR